MVAAVLCAGGLVAGCGSGENQAGSGQSTGGGGVGATTGVGGATGGDCPVTEAELSSATSLSWEHGDTLKDHPLETMESVKATVCVFTAPEAVQMGGDPLALRVDVIDPQDADTMRKDFSSTCTESGGTVRAAGGGTVCEHDDGTVGYGHTGNLVIVYFVNANKDTAAKLTPSFEKVLASAG
jgi:hypothetical protein